jgi:hypothetical protein
MSAPVAAAAFARLKQALPGRWEGTRPDGRPVGVDYRLSASGSALVETWALGPNVEALTIYHLDGERLIASHFCPLGNQPRLHLTGDADSRFEFEFLDATGLAPSEAHQRSFWIALGPDATFQREEIYGDGVSEETERVAFARVRSA